MNLGIEERHPHTFGSKQVRARPRQAPDQSVKAKAAQVVRHLRRRVGGAEQAGDEGTKAPVVEAGDGVHRQTQGAGQSHDA